jgi:hypothetical protein
MGIVLVGHAPSQRCLFKLLPISLNSELNICASAISTCCDTQKICIGNGYLPDADQDVTGRTTASSAVRPFSTCCTTIAEPLRVASRPTSVRLSRSWHHLYRGEEKKNEANNCRALHAEMPPVVIISEAAVNSKDATNPLEGSKRNLSELIRVRSADRWRDRISVRRKC